MVTFFVAMLKVSNSNHGNAGWTVVAMHKVINCLHSISQGRLDHNGKFTRPAAETEAETLDCNIASICPTQTKLQL